MLKVEVIVRPERVGAVTSALDEAGCTGYHYTNVTGQGRQGGRRHAGFLPFAPVERTPFPGISDLLDKLVEDHFVTNFRLRALELWHPVFRVVVGQVRPVVARRPYR